MSIASSIRSARSNNSLLAKARAYPALVKSLGIGWLVPALLLLAWWLGSEWGWVSAQTLPHPSDVIYSLQNLYYSGELAEAVHISLTRVLVGFALGASLGLVVGAAMGLSEQIRDYVYPLYRFVAYVPLLGWLPLLILLLGIGEALKFALIAKAAFIPVTTNTYQGIRNIPTQYREVARLYHFTHWQYLRLVLWPAAFPSVWSGLRYGLTHCWLVLVLVELLASSEGLGYMMHSGQQLMQLDLVLVSVFMVGAIGFLLDALLERIERHLLRWRKESFA